MSKLELLILLWRNICRAGARVAVRQLCAKDQAKSTEVEEWLEATFHNDDDDDDYDEW